MKSIFILGLFLLLLVMLLGCKEEPRTIKSSEIKDAAITPNMHGCGIGILSDKKTGRVEGILYEEMQFVRIEERDSLLEELNKLKDTVFVSLIEPPSKLDKPVFDIVAHRKVTVEQAWENDKCFNLRQLSTIGWYKGCIVYNKKVNEPLDPSKEYPKYLGPIKKITPIMVYAEREKAANFMIAYVRKMKGKECNE